MAKEFDKVTHIRNSKGIIIRKNPYRLFIRGSEWKYERPPKSGNFYAPNGDLIEGPLFDEQEKAKNKAEEEAKALARMVEQVKEEDKAEAKPALEEKVSGSAAKKVSKN